MSNRCRLADQKTSPLQSAPEIVNLGHPAGAVGRPNLFAARTLVGAENKIRTTGYGNQCTPAESFTASNRIGAHSLCSRKERRIEATLAYMRHHFREPLRVSTLCSIAGVSAPRFYQLFKLQTGYTPIDFLIHLRMQRACRLLENEEFSVKAVAARVGYKDPLHFSRLFKSVNGMAPSAFRARLTDSTATKDRIAQPALEEHMENHHDFRLPIYRETLRQNSPAGPPFDPAELSEAVNFA
jgi:AraC-like DNA-binding protein